MLIESLRIAGEKVATERHIEVRNPFTRELVGTVPKATIAQVRQAFAAAHAYKPTLTRFERANILNKTAAIVRARTAEIAALITAECGLCLKDSTYEAGRVADVLMFGANACLTDDAQTFSCDITPHGRKRRVYTQRDPLLGVISAITPFNHPMNQVAHKVVPSVATNNRMVLKPSEKVPFSAILFADILYEAGLPPEMLSIITGDHAEHLGRQARFIQDVGEQQGRERHLFRGLEHHAIVGGHTGHDLVRHLVHGVVERRDGGDDTQQRRALGVDAPLLAVSTPNAHRCWA